MEVWEETAQERQLLSVGSQGLDAATATAGRGQSPLRRTVTDTGASKNDRHLHCDEQSPRIAFHPATEGSDSAF